MMTSTKTSSLRTRGKYRLIEFIRPGCFWPQPYCLEQALGIYRWMVETAMVPKYYTRWGCNPTLAQLFPTSGRVRSLAYSDDYAISSIKNLRERFQYAFFSGYGGEQWRRDFAINQFGVRVLVFPHYRLTEAPTSEHDFREGLEALWATTPPKGQIFALLTTQLNSYHADAVECYGAPVYLRDAAAHGKPARLCWEFVLHYGCDGSVWHKSLASQKPGEAFRDLFVRAEAEYRRLTA